MKIGKSIYKTLFIVSLTLQILFPSFEFIFLFNLIITTSLILENKFAISKKVFNIIAYLSIILCVGLIISLFNSTTFYGKFKDLIHFSKPILLITSGYLLSKKIKSFSFIIKSFVWLGVLFAIAHLSKFAFVDLTKGTIEEIRLRIGSQNFLELIAFILLITYRKTAQILKSELLRNLFLFILGLSLITYFSRTMLVGLFVFLLSILGYTRLSRKTLEYSSLLLVLFSLFYIYLWTLDLDPDKKGINSFFFKVRNAPAEVFSSPDKYNPNNHREIFNHWRGYEAKRAFLEMKKTPISFITGKGFGSLVDLGFKAPIGGENGLRYIPFLHNSYVYIYFKTGVLGLFLYIILLINLFKTIYIKEQSIITKIISGFGLYFIATGFVISGIYNLEELSVFFLGVFLHLNHKEKNNPHYNE